MRKCNAYTPPPPPPKKPLAFRYRGRWGRLDQVARQRHRCVNIFSGLVPWQVMLAGWVPAQPSSEKRLP